MTSEIGQRKTDHIQLTVHEDVAFRQKGTLFDCLHLVHEALPEVHADELDTSSSCLGKELRFPLLIAAMTGGTSEAGKINAQLAEVAERRGYAFGLGSQRAMAVRPDATNSYQVRSQAPSALVLGNLGMVQAAQMSSAEINKLVADVGADALCIHLNPAMEIVQPGGDRDFRGGVATFQRLVNELRVPVIAKETGCGISHRTARRLRSLGVCHVDVSGAGGTSWVAVETHRAEGAARSLGERFWDWGVPTAASVGFAAEAAFQTIFATGGLSTGVEVAKALVLGASVAGMARPLLQVLIKSGPEALEAHLDHVEAEFRATMLLVGARNLKELRQVPYWSEGRLRSWLKMGAPKRCMRP